MICCFHKFTNILIFDLGLINLSEMAHSIPFKCLKNLKYPNSILLNFKVGDDMLNIFRVTRVLVNILLTNSYFVVAFYESQKKICYVKFVKCNVNIFVRLQKVYLRVKIIMPCKHNNINYYFNFMCKNLRPRCGSS